MLCLPASSHRGRSLGAATRDAGRARTGQMIETIGDPVLGCSSTRGRSNGPASLSASVAARPIPRPSGSCGSRRATHNQALNARDGAGLPKQAYSQRDSQRAAAAAWMWIWTVVAPRRLGLRYSGPGSPSMMVSSPLAHIGVALRTLRGRCSATFRRSRTLATETRSPTRRPHRSGSSASILPRELLGGR